jgi:flagellar protein FlaJ
MPPEQVIGQLSEGYGELSEGFEKASKAIKRGSTLGEALGLMAHDSPSHVVRQALSLLAEGLESGADVGAALKKTAEHARAIQRVQAERKAIIAVEKHTLLLAGGLLVPLLLGTMSKVVGGMGLGSSAVAEAAVLGSQVYLVEYAVIASGFAGMLEGNWRKGLKYAVVLVPASLGLFYLAA